MTIAAFSDITAYNLLYQLFSTGAPWRHEWQSGAPLIFSYLAVKKSVMANLIFGVG
jgi:hypothetical protein